MPPATAAPASASSSADNERRPPSGGDSPRRRRRDGGGVTEATTPDPRGNRGGDTTLLRTPRAAAHDRRRPPVPSSVALRNLFPPSSATFASVFASPPAGAADYGEGGSSDEESGDGDEGSDANENDGDIDECNDEGGDDYDYNDAPLRSYPPKSSSASSSLLPLNLGAEVVRALVSREVLAEVRLELVVTRRRTAGWRLPLAGSTSGEGESGADAEDGPATESFDEASNPRRERDRSGGEVVREVDAGDEIEEGEEDMVVFSSRRPHSAAHPRWDHLDERVDFLDRSVEEADRGEKDLWRWRSDDDGGGRGECEIPGDNDDGDNDGSEDWDDAYRTLRARIFVRRRTDAGGIARRGDGDRRDRECDNDDDEILLLEAPLHPTRLRRLPGGCGASSTSPARPLSGKDGDNNSGGSGRNVAGGNESLTAPAVPPALPPNALLVRYDDGSTRVTPSLYWLLVRRGIVSEVDPTTTTSPTPNQRIEGRGEGGSRFEDDAFRVLGNYGGDDGVGVDRDDTDGESGESGRATASGFPEGGGRGGKGNALSSTFDDVDDSVFDLLGEKVPASETTAVAATEPPSDENEKVGTTGGSMFDDCAFDLMWGGGASSAKAPASSADGGASSSGGNDFGSGRAGEEKDCGVDGAIPPSVREKEDAGGEDPSPSAQVEAAAITTRPALNGAAAVVWPVPSSDEGGEERLNATAAAEGNIGTTDGSNPSTMASPLSLGSHPPLLPPLPISMRGKTPSDARRSLAELGEILLLEKRSLKMERRDLERESSKLKSIMGRVHHLNNETVETMRAVGTERASLFGSEFRLETRRIQLLKSLRLIYPIRMLSPDRQYSIAGIPLPDDVHNPSSTDEEISAALGFLCHLVFLTGKYLSISLRHRLVCHSSRSAIVQEDNDDGGDNGDGFGFAVGSSGAGRRRTATRAAYPLFRERGVVDREELDRAADLLHRNVDCLLTSRGVQSIPTSAGLLAKMDRLLAHIIEGDDR